MNETAPKLVLSSLYKVEWYLFPFLLIFTVVVSVIVCVVFGMIEMFIIFACLIALFGTMVYFYVAAGHEDTIIMTEESITIQRDGAIAGDWKWEDVHWHLYRSANGGRYSTDYCFLWTDEPSPLFEVKPGDYSRDMRDAYGYCLVGEEMSQLIKLCCPNPPICHRCTPERNYRELDAKYIRTPEQIARYQKMQPVFLVLSCVLLTVGFMMLYLCAGDEPWMGISVALIIVGCISMVLCVGVKETVIRSFSAAVWQNRLKRRREAEGIRE